MSNIALSNDPEWNQKQEARELDAWKTRPDRFVAYYVFPSEHPENRHYRGSFFPPVLGATVTTWPGTTIGTITSAHVYRHNFGGRFVRLRAKGSNGAEYYGRASWDGGNAIVLRKVKGAC